MLYGVIFGVVVVILIGIGVLFGGAPFVPTRRKWIKQAFELSEINSNDVIVDLGSGNGAVLEMALNYNVKKAIGYEVNPILATWSRWKLRKFNNRVSIKTRDFFRSDLPEETTIIYMFQVNSVLKRIVSYIELQKPKLTKDKVRVVCFGFEIPGVDKVRELGGMTLYEF